MAVPSWKREFEKRAYGPEDPDWDRAHGDAQSYMDTLIGMLGQMGASKAQAEAKKVLKSWNKVYQLARKGQ